MRRRTASIAVTTILIAVMAIPLPAGGVAGFGDIDTGKFYTEPVQWMVDNNITTGTSATCFSPGEVVTRGQIAAFMWRMEGSPTGSPAHAFTDVTVLWQQEPISWMAAQGITTGTSPTTYSPDNPVTRGEVAALLHRLAGSPDAPAPTQFSDVVKAWQITPVGWMVQQAITTGTTATTFSPDDTVTRGQVAAFFYRYKGSPSVTVNPNHPAIPVCAAQVPGPATTGTLRITLDTQLIQNHNGPIEIVADNVTLDCAGHTVTGNGTGTGIELNGRTGVTIRNCDVSGFQHGIILLDSNLNTIERNQVHDNLGPKGSPGGATPEGGRGIALWASDQNTLTGNEVRANGDHGFGIGGDFNRIEGNQAVGNGVIHADGSGIRLGDGATGNEVINNRFDENRIGISPWMTSGGANTFTGNTANNNSLWGIEDQTSGGTGTAGTDNTYTNNTCTGNGAGNSSPYGLCWG